MSPSERFAIIPGICSSEEDFQSLCQCLAEASIETEFYEPEPVSIQALKADVIKNVTDRDASFIERLRSDIQAQRISGIIAQSRGCYQGMKAVSGFSIPTVLVCPPSKRRRNTGGTMQQILQYDLGPNHTQHADFIRRFTDNWNASPYRHMNELTYLAQTAPSLGQHLTDPDNDENPIQIFAQPNDAWYTEPPNGKGVIVSNIDGAHHYPLLTHSAKSFERIMQYVRSFRFATEAIAYA